MPKPIWLSKTVWVNLLFALLAFVPSVKEYVVAHPELVTLVFTGVNIVLRFVTKDAVQLWE